MEENKTAVALEHPRLIPANVFIDNRGWFYEAYNRNSYDIASDFVQDNHSYSEFKGTVRGLHFQKPPYQQAKLIRVLNGKIFDVVIDLRPNSKNYLQVNTYELDSKRKDSLYIPKGFAHGFMTLEDHTEVYYKVDEVYSKSHEVTIVFDDPHLTIPWPNCFNVTLSVKDSKGIGLLEAIELLKEAIE